MSRLNECVEAWQRRQPRPDPEHVEAATEELLDRVGGAHGWRSPVAPVTGIMPFVFARS